MSDTINLLLLGETGVGKTTFVNSFLNYSLNSNGSDVHQNGVVVAAPMNISFTSSDGKHHVIPIQASMEKSNASTDGKFNEYFIPVGERQVRLIDSVGFENLTSGEETFEDVFKQLAPLKELHGVCFLIKSSLSRMSNLFESYIMQTIAALDLPATKNFIFIFTYGRNVNFNPEHAISVMTGFVDSVRSRIKAKIPLSKNNIFCVENEGFVNFGMQHKMKLHLQTIKYSVQSWNTSANECKKLLSYVEALPPYKFPTRGVTNVLEQFIIQKSYTLCDIFGENFKNLQKCKQLRDRSEEACRLFQSLQQQKFTSSERDSSRSGTQNQQKAEDGKFNNSLTKSRPSAYLTDDESPSETERSKHQHSQEGQSKGLKNTETRQTVTQNKQSSTIYTQLNFGSLPAEITKHEKLKLSKSHHRSRDSLLDDDVANSHDDKSRSRHHKREGNGNEGQGSIDKGHSNSRNHASDSQHYKQTTRSTPETPNTTLKKKVDKIADIMKDQVKVIENMEELTRKIHNIFLKDIAKFEIFLEINSMNNDVFNKKIKSLLYRQTDREVWEKMFRDYDAAKNEVRENSEYNLTDEDIEKIRQKIEKLHTRQDIVNKIFKD